MGDYPAILGPFLALLKSRKFLVLTLDTIISIALHYYGGPNIEFLIIALQPVAMMIIYAIAKEDAAEKSRAR